MNRAVSENGARSAAILMGGKALRMKGMAKYALKDSAGIPYICLQAQALRKFDSLYLSAASIRQLREAEAVLSAKTGGKPDFIGIIDSAQFPDAGPLGGLYTVLSDMVRQDQAGRTEWLFVTACDMPGLTADMPAGLNAYLEDGYDCVVCQDRKGRIHPLCGYYRVSVLPVIWEMLERKEYRMTNLLIRSRCKIVTSEELGISDSVFENMNSPEDLQQYRKKAKIFCICGVKNSGKTIYIERLVKALTEQGKKVAVIKHDGHDFEGDRPGTDTYRHHQAGAYGTAVYSSARYMVNKEQEMPDVQQFIGLFPEADVILIEGMKGSSFPKVELIRRGISETISCNRENLMAVVTDRDSGDDDFGEIPVWTFNALEACLTCIEGL